MLGPAKRENSILKKIRAVAKPQPAAMYRAPPNDIDLRREDLEDGLGR